MKALLIPVEGPVQELELDSSARSQLQALQDAVGGYVQALPIPQFIDGAEKATAYVNEEGKFLPSDPWTDDGGREHPGFKANMRATDFMVPGVGLFMGDYIAGPMLLLGFDPQTGDHADVPQGIVDRVRLIEEEAS